MPAIISEKFRIFNAKQFLESLSEGTPAGSAGDSSVDRTRLYFFIGRPQQWKGHLEIYNKNNANFTVNQSISSGSWSATVAEVYDNSLLVTGMSVGLTPTSGSTVTGSVGSGTAPTAKIGSFRYATEDSPLNPFDNQDEKYEIYSDMLASKRIDASSARHVTRRYNYSTAVNPKFDMWRSDYSSLKTTATGASSLSQGKYVVVNSVYEVFACVYNGTSVTNPSGTTINEEPNTTSANYTGGYYTQTDGNYKWKYLYTISTTDVIKFLSSDFMPVIIDSTVKAAAVDGGIQAVVVRDVGTSSTFTANRSITTNPLYAPIVGDGSNGIVKFGTNSNGQITSAAIHAPGTGYTYGNVLLQTGTTAGGARGVFTDSALTSVSTVTTSTTGGVGNIEVIIPPQGGYGFDAISETGAKRVMLNVRLESLEGIGDFPIDNDFRRIGVIQDPLQFDSTAYFTNPTASMLRAIKITGANGNFTVDNIITQGSGNTQAKGTIVSWTLDEGSNSNGILKYYQTPEYHSVTGKVNAFTSAGGTISELTPAGTSTGRTGSVDTTYGNVSSSTLWSSGGTATLNAFIRHDVTSNIAGQGTVTQTIYYKVTAAGTLGTTAPTHTSGAAANGTATLTVHEPVLGTLYQDGLSSPEIKYNSGEIIYVENRRLVTRAQDQIEDIKLIIEF